MLTAEGSVFFFVCVMLSYLILLTTRHEHGLIVEIVSIQRLPDSQEVHHWTDVGCLSPFQAVATHHCWEYFSSLHPCSNIKPEHFIPSHVPRSSDLLRKYETRLTGSLVPENLSDN